MVNTERVEVIKMVDEKDLLLEIDICTTSKHTSCLKKIAEDYGIEGFKKIFFTNNGNRFVTEGMEPGEYFELDYPDKQFEEIEMVICKNKDIQVHKVPAEVNINGGCITFEVYKDMVKTDKYYVKSISF